MLQDATQKQPVEPLAFYYLVRCGGAARATTTSRARALLDYEVLRGDETDARRRERVRDAARRSLAR